MAGIDVVVDDGIGLVTLRNPPVRNALTARLWDDLGAAVAALDANDDVAAIVVRGHGGHFSAGADIADLPDDPGEIEGLLDRADAVLADSTTPVIAAVDGYCVGGGCAIAVAAHQRFASTRARFGITASRLGIVYPAGPTRRLMGLVGPSTARRMLTAAELHDAEWALRVGLVDELVDLTTGVEVSDRAVEYARLLARRSAVSVSAALTLTTSWDADTPERADGHADYREGRAAFGEKRTPDFPSRATGADGE